MHHVGHAHARVKYGLPVDPSGIDVIREESNGAVSGLTPERSSVRSGQAQPPA